MKWVNLQHLVEEIIQIFGAHLNLPVNKCKSHITLLYAFIQTSLIWHSEKNGVINKSRSTASDNNLAAETIRHFSLHAMKMAVPLITRTCMRMIQAQKYRY